MAEFNPYGIEFGPPRLDGTIMRVARTQDVAGVVLMTLYQLLGVMACTRIVHRRSVSAV